MKQLVILEKATDGVLWGRLELAEGLITTCGQNLQVVKDNLQDLLKDYLENEGAQDVNFLSVDRVTIEFEFVYDLTAIFEVFDSLKISSVASLSNINPSLVRQYVAGIKHPSLEQVNKIEKALHQLGKQLSEVRLI